MTSKTKQILLFFNLLLQALLSSIFFIPLALFIPIKKRSIVIIGRDRGSFSDNTKHFFLFLQNINNSDFFSVFLSSNKTTIAQLSHHSLPCLYYPSFKGFYYLLRAEYIMIDSAEWISGGKFQLSFGSKLLQLWHGAPLKEIELPLYQRRLKKLSFLPRLILRFQKKIIGRYPEYFALASTSKFFTQKAFSSAFRAKHFIEYGYPRNDSILQGKEDEQRNSPIWINCDLQALQLIDKARSNKFKIILYAPTFRSDLTHPFSENILSLQALNKFANNNNILFVMKLHPIMAKQFSSDNLSNIIHYATENDVYPALSLFDCLVTDYSSIYFDYLFLDKPIIFFPYDFDNYVSDERELLFDYNEMAPGHLCNNQIELQAAILKPDTENWKIKRKKILNKVFDHFDDKAGKRLFDFLRNP